MPKKKLFITDERMLLLVDYALKNGLANTKKEYFKKIKFTQNSFQNVLNGLQGFTKEQILNACLFTGASADFIFGFTDDFKRAPAKSAIKGLKDAVYAVEVEMKLKEKKK